MGLCYVSEHTGAALDIRRHHIRAQPQSATKSEGQQESDYGVPGIGGFFNVTQSADRVVFCGQFTAGDSDVVIENGRLVIRKDGDVTKFVEAVEQITFNAKVAKDRGQSVLVVTERAVFQVDENGPILIEIAPGVDLERDVLAKMAFRPRVADDLREMAAELFQAETIGLPDRLGESQS